MQVESIALSRDVPAIFAWFVNPLIRRVSRETLAHLLEATRRGLLSASAMRVHQERSANRSANRLSAAQGTALVGNL
jgi:hypothetical protein